MSTPGRTIDVDALSATVLSPLLKFHEALSNRRSYAYNQATFQPSTPDTRNICEVSDLTCPDNADEASRGYKKFPEDASSCLALHNPYSGEMINVLMGFTHSATVLTCINVL